MAKKAPRRTAERILQTTLELFNRYGEPNVSTTLISSELGISPGNLYYHYPAKDELVNALFTHYKAAMLEWLITAPQVKSLQDSWFFLQQLNERVWQHRFIYRDLNDLIGRNRRIETEMKEVLQHKATSLEVVLSHLCHTQCLDMTEAQRRRSAHQLVLQCTWWLSYAYVLNPRQALEDSNGPSELARAMQSQLGLLRPYVRAAHTADMDRWLNN